MSYHAIICAALSAEIHWLVTDAFVENSIREHALFCDSEYECTEGGVFVGLALRPHL